MSPKPIIHTRIPAELQQVFLRSNRGEEVHDAPPSQLCRRWDPSAEKKKERKSACFRVADRKPIIRTRIPAELQQVFLRSNRGEEVHDAPPSQLCRKWEPKAENRRRKSATFRSKIDDATTDAPPSPPTRKTSFSGPEDLVIVCQSAEDELSATSSHYSNDDSFILAVEEETHRVTRWESDVPKSPTTRRRSITLNPPKRSRERSQEPRPVRH